MAQYVLLLRGVNVGGKNKVSMVQLKEALQQQGFTKVQSYINSGNLIFSSPLSSAAAVETICQQVIFEEFGLSIPLVAIPAEEYAASLEQAPAWWDKGEGLQHNSLVLCPPATMKELVASLGKTDPSIEQYYATKTHLFWTIRFESYNKGLWKNLMKHPLYPWMTIRNANTTKQLDLLLQAPAEK